MGKSPPIYLLIHARGLIDSVDVPWRRWLLTILAGGLWVVSLVSGQPMGAVLIPIFYILLFAPLLEICRWAVELEERLQHLELEALGPATSGPATTPIV